MKGSWMYVFGGNNSTSYSNELKILNLGFFLKKKG